MVNFSKHSVAFIGMLRKTLRAKNTLKYVLKYKLRYKTNDKIILFETFSGKSYGCSPKAIYERMHNNA